MQSFLLLILLCVAKIGNGFQFASYYQSNMVLQRKPHRAVIWGYGLEGAVVNVFLFQDVYSTQVDKTGRWTTTLNPYPATGQITIKATEISQKGIVQSIALENVCFGELWVCSGQSNMEFTVPMVYNASYEINAASNYPDIRLFTVSMVWSNKSLDDLKHIEQNWSVASNETVNGGPWKYFSAVCWLFGKYLYDSIKVPIGLVATDWGGTPVEAWSSKDALLECDLVERDTAVLAQNRNSVLWNAMIFPLLRMTIKGVIWYQGEQNTRYHSDYYSCSFPAMVSDWRRSWNAGTKGQTDLLFPFGFVQLSAVNEDSYKSFSNIRWHQTADYGYVPNPKLPNTFMAVAMDLPDNNSPYVSVHPRDKQDVAARLVLGALSCAYGLHYKSNGPVIKSALRTADSNVLLIYSHDQVLSVQERGNFKVCCNFSNCSILADEPSHEWVWAPIVHNTSNTITLYAGYCALNGGFPAAVRYAWGQRPCNFKDCSVYSDLGLPAPPGAILVSKL